MSNRSSLHDFTGEQQAKTSEVLVSHATVPPKDAQRWDQFLATTPGGDIVQSSVWASSKRVMGFDSQSIILFNEDQIWGGAQIIIKQFGPFRVGYIARGPVMAFGYDHRASELLDAVEKKARAFNVHHLIIQPPAGGYAIQEQLAARGYTPDAPEVAPSATLMIDLNQSLDEILGKVSSKQRKEIRRSQREGVSAKMGARSDVSSFHALYEASAHRHGFEALSKPCFYDQWDILHPPGFIQVVLAYHNDMPLAGSWLSAFGGTVTQRLPGWDGVKSHLHPKVACVWKAIQWAKEHGYQYYDLGGINRRYAEILLANETLPEDFYRSPAVFKRKWGGQAVLYPPASQRTFNPLARFIIQTAYPRFKDHRLLRRLLSRARNR